MVRGRLRCIGTSLRLKSRFGSGYRISVRICDPSTSLPGGPSPSNNLDQAKNGIKSIFTRRLGVQSGACSAPFSCRYCYAILTPTDFSVCSR